MNVRGSSSAVEYAKKSFGMDPVNQITAFAKAENDEIDLLGGSDRLTVQWGAKAGLAHREGRLHTAAARRDKCCVNVATCRVPSAPVQLVPCVFFINPTPACPPPTNSRTHTHTNITPLRSAQGKGLGAARPRERQDAGHAQLDRLQHGALDWAVRQQDAVL